MHYVLQDYEDTARLAEILERAGLEYSMHKVVPFIGELEPEPVILEHDRVVMFGSYSLRHYAHKHNLTPGVFELRPFYHEQPWMNFLLNGPRNSELYTIKDLAAIDPIAQIWFIRPLQDSKEIAGAVKAAA